jgi:hypothetical protein
MTEQIESTTQVGTAVGKARKPVAGTLATEAEAGIKAAERIEQIEARLKELAAIENRCRQSRHRFTAANLRKWRAVATGAGPNTGHRPKRNQRRSNEAGKASRKAS